MHTVPGSLLFLAFAATMPAQTPAFTFTVDGVKATPPVVAESGELTPRAGDLIEFKDRLWLRLDEPGDYEFVDRWTRGTVERNGIVVAASETSLLALDDVAKRALRGVRLTAWNDRLAAAVRTLPPDVPLTLTRGTAIDGYLPQLPSSTQNLWLQGVGAGFDLLPAAALRELRTLRIDGSRLSRLDLSPFADTRQLQWLRLSNVRLPDGGSLLRFTQLRAFIADDVDVDASWLAMAKDLRRVEVRDGTVRSLEALAVLPNLVEIVIDRRGIRTAGRANAPPAVLLPTSRFPKLRRLELRNTNVSVDEAREFRSVNPQCRIVGVPLPEQHFAKALATADRVVLDGRAGLPRHETTDMEAVGNAAAMFASLSDEEPRSAPRPELVLEFFAGAERIARFEIQGMFVSVTDGRWPGDYRFDLEAHRALRQWLRSITPPAAK